MDFFPISKSEAILIGRCLEEYLQTRADEEYHAEKADEEYIEMVADPDNFETAAELEEFRAEVAAEHDLPSDDPWPYMPFLYFLRTRLDQFIPSGALMYTSKRVSLEDIPDDVQWSPDESGFCYAPSTPHQAFWAGDRGGICFAKDSSAIKSLDFLIVELLWKHITKNDFDIVGYPVDDVIEWGQHVHRRNQHLNDGTFSIEWIGEDECAAIEQVLTQLVSSKGNLLKEPFELGRLFGKMLSDCYRYEAGIFTKLGFVTEETGFTGTSEIKALCSLGREIETWRPISTVEWLRSMQDGLSRLLENDDLVSLTCCNTLLQRSFQMICSDLAADDCADRYPTGDAHPSSVRSAIFMAMGEVIGRARSDDELAKQKHAALVTPRMLKLSPSSPPDKIKNTLQFIQQALNDWTRQSLSPEFVVSCLSNGIEALAKRTWPKHFEGPRIRVKLKGVLEERQRNGDEQEQKFARSALTLYNNYRNQEEHDYDRFQCSLAEAIHFMYGIRVLMELSEDITNQKS